MLVGSVHQHLSKLDRLFERHLMLLKLQHLNMRPGFVVFVVIACCICDRNLQRQVADEVSDPSESTRSIWKNKHLCHQASTKPTYQKRRAIELSVATLEYGSSHQDPSAMPVSVTWQLDQSAACLYLAAGIRHAFCKPEAYAQTHLMADGGDFQQNSLSLQP